MNELSSIEMEVVSGGCAAHCWGDFDAGALGANIVGGAITGARGGVAGMALGGAGGGLTYLLSVMWTRS